MGSPQLRRIFHSKTEFHRDLEVVDIALLDVAANLSNLKPVQVSHCRTGPRDAISDGLINTLS